MKKNYWKSMNNCLAGLLLCLAGVLLPLSCSDDEPATNVPDGLNVPEKVLNQGLSFGKEGGTQTFSVQSRGAVEASSDQSWCTVAAGQQTEMLKVTTLVVTVQANTETEDRTAILTLTADGESAQVSIRQTATDGLVVEQDTYTVPAAGGPLTINLTSNGEYAYTIHDTWIAEATVSAGTKAMTPHALHFSVSANHGPERTGTITFTLGALTETVSIVQEAGQAASISGETPYEIAASMGLGWNLGNQLDAHNSGVANETAWGNKPATQALFDQVAAAGITTVRIPVTWMGNIGDAPDYTIDPAYLDRVAEVVGYAESAGLNAILNIHHDGADSQYWLDIKGAAEDEATNEAVKAQLRAVWSQIAARFADKGNFLMFEAMNEIHDGGWGWGANRTDGGRQYAVLNEWNQLFVNTVRAAGGSNTDRYLGVPGYVTNIDLTVANFVLPTDAVANRLLVSVHYYDPMDYSMNNVYTEWGHTAAPDRKADYGDEDYMTSQFNAMKTTFIDRGIPAYIGEMGCVHRPGNDRDELFRLYYLEYLCKAAKDYGMAPFYWDAGGDGSGNTSALFDRATGAFVHNAQEVIDVMKRAVFTQDAAYTLQSVYDGAPQ